MGQGYNLHCRKCGYATTLTLGVGFAYNEIYAEAQEKGKRGDLGDEVRQFLEENSSGIIDFEPVALLCEKCGEYVAEPSFNMYIPDEAVKATEEPKSFWSYIFPFFKKKNNEYISPLDFKSRYKLYKEYPHICEKCGEKMKMFGENDIQKLKCPKCKEAVLESQIAYLWD